MATNASKPISQGRCNVALKFQKKWDVSRPQQNVGLIEAITLSLLSAVLSDFSMRGPSRFCFPLLLQHESEGTNLRSGSTRTNVLRQSRVVKRARLKQLFDGCSCRGCGIGKMEENFDGDGGAVFEVTGGKR
jgi:hypothetical protein